MKYLRKIVDLETILFCHYKMIEKFMDIKLWLITVLVMPFTHHVNKYLFNDWQFIKWLLILMALDLFTGVWRASREGKMITSRGFRDTVTKMIQYGVFLIVIHILMNYEINGEPVGLFSWMDDAAYTFLMVIESKSIWENLTKMRDHKFDLTWFIERITFKKK